MNRIVVVGASLAGLTAVETLREEGFDGELVLINGETHNGYDRPPLSKKVLSGVMNASEVMLKSSDFFVTNRIDHRIATYATALDLNARTIALGSGEVLAFDGLLVATGLRPRPLPRQPVLRGVHMLRTLDDAIALRADMMKEKVLKATAYDGTTSGSLAIVIVGAGFLGCEVAATARQMGLQVILVDPLELPMARQVGCELAGALVRKHMHQGVDVRCRRSVSSFQENKGQLSGVTLDDGSQIPTRIVVVTIGSLPNTEWLQSSGVPLDNGVVCDSFCRAAPGVYAAGDVASWLHPRLGVQMRLEHRMHATQQAMAAARNMLGADIAFDSLPYFWTDFYDTRIQVYGRIPAEYEMTVLSGHLGESNYTVAFSRGGIIEAVAGWNAGRDIHKISILVGKPALKGVVAV
jgi:NADPH-dependent 2,4-dienoyl-CoA reductase/sulfur reductase-like enzyme